MRIKWLRYKLIIHVIFSCILAIAFSGITPWLFSQKAYAHNVAQVQTTKFFAPETIQLIKDRAATGTPGLKAGDIISYIMQFTPVANGATIGPGGYVTDYMPPNTEVVGAAIVQPNGAGGYTQIAPDLPGPISNGWAPRGQQTYLAPFNTNTYDKTGLCAAAGFTNNCDGSVAQVYADTGIFYSTDPRTAGYFSPSPDGRIRQGTNGYNIAPTSETALNTIIGQAQATTHNLWDADQTNAFGSAQAAITALTSPKSSAAALIVTKPGQGAAPFNAGSVVAGTDAGYKLDNTGQVGPWRRIAYPNSRIGNPTGPATSITGSYNDPINSSTAVVGTYTNAGWNLSPSNPLPSGTNAVRWAIGRLVVGDVKYVQISLRLTANPPINGFINNSEVFGGDSAEAAGKAGNDQAWRYHVPSVANLESNLSVFKEVVKVNSQLSAGAVIPANAKVRYRITYLNTGANPLTNVVLSDTLPSQTGSGSVSNLAVVSGQNILPINPTSPTAGGTFSFQSLGSLIPGAGGVIEFDVQTTAALGSLVINKSKLVSSESPIGSTSNAASTVISTAKLQVSKSVSPSNIAPGGTVTYNLTVSNIGNASASSIVVNDFLPTSGGANNANTRFNFISGSSLFTGITSVTPTAIALPNIIPYTTENRQQVTWNFGAQTLATGASFTIRFQAQAGSAVPTSTTGYTNDAKVVYNDGTASNEANAIANAPVMVSLPTDLAITKIADKTTVAPGSAINYTITLKNNGPNTINSAIVNDAVPPTIGNPTFTTNTGSYDSSTGSWTGLNLTAGQSVTLALSGIVSSTATGTLTNTATVTAPAGITDTVSNNNSSTATTTITGSAELILVKRLTAINGTSFSNFFINDPSSTNDNAVNWPLPLDPTTNISTFLKGKIQASVVPNDEVEYTIYFLSNGGSAAQNVKFCDLIPQNNTFISTTYNGLTPTDGGKPGADSGIAIAMNASVPTAYLSDVADTDRGEFVVAGTIPPVKCSGSNNYGATVVTLGDLAPNSYGFVRFRATVD